MGAAEIPAVCEACGALTGEYKHINTTNGALKLCPLCLGDINRKNPELIALKKTLVDCCESHVRASNEYERGGNDRGAIVLRSVANLLGVIIQGGTPTTVLPGSTEVERVR